MSDGNSLRARNDDGRSVMMISEHMMACYDYDLPRAKRGVINFCNEQVV